MELEFYGAAGEVTGSCHIVRVADHQVLLDCGLIQGGRRDENRNRDDFPFEPSSIDAVILSHAHLDHSGRLPLLVRGGFNGPIYAQNATRDLVRVLLLDAADIAERDTEKENRRRERKGLEAVEPLYTRDDALAAWKLIRGLPYRQDQQVVAGLLAQFHDAGHILGSAAVVLQLRQGGDDRKLVFSGDLGQYGAPILNDPEDIGPADIVLMESTYGGRVHRSREDTIAEIGEIISDAHHEHGNILIPAFAIGRSQEVLYTLGKNYDDWSLGDWHVFLDSPMAIDASHIYWDYPHLYDKEATKLRQKINEMPKLANLHLTSTPAESQVINRLTNGAIVIAGSGMCNGGRILHHLKHNIWRKQCQIVIVGYQAKGSLGRRLVEGAQHIRIHGETLRVAAQIHTVGGLSAHGDENDLARWYGNLTNSPPVYLVHGEPRAAQALKKKLGTDCRADVNIAEPGMKVDLLA
ncbi:MAG: MBL fold metallo-hydrolase [Gammaproteobacteria bacterium]|nr:MBL fold metallo-hydrolase [Gammaproteobacteria bacterium]